MGFAANGTPKAEVVLTAEERAQLQRWARGASADDDNAAKRRAESRAAERGITGHALIGAKPSITFTSRPGQQV